jgi:hypothetical protein
MYHHDNPGDLPSTDTTAPHHQPIGAGQLPQIDRATLTDRCSLHRSEQGALRSAKSLMTAQEEPFKARKPREQAYLKYAAAIARRSATPKLAFMRCHRQGM